MLSPRLVLRGTVETNGAVEIFARLQRAQDDNAGGDAVNRQGLYGRELAEMGVLRPYMITQGLMQSTNAYQDFCLRRFVMWAVWCWPCHS